METEAEGANWDFISTLSRTAKEISLPLYIKIGGCEAKTDIGMAFDRAIEGIIAPMIESPFAVEKFDDATRNFDFKWRALTLETVTAYRNRAEIIHEAKIRGINGITVGRGDFSASLGRKGEEDSAEVMAMVDDFGHMVRKSGLHFSIGGKMNLTSLKAVMSLKNFPDFLETRRVVFHAPTPNQSETELKGMIANAVDFEIDEWKAREKTALGDVAAAKLRLEELVKRKFGYPN